jgi:endogenous inhibitor of DNA gyrase (YacG/DUF329 family)
MKSESHHPAEDLLTQCTWCGAPLAYNLIPAEYANLFCSRHCEIDANFWLLQEMCDIEINYLVWPPARTDDTRDCA